MKKQGYLFSFFIALITIISIALFTIDGEAQNKNGKNGKNGKSISISIPVTIHTDSERTRALAGDLQPQDFVVSENKQKQQITSVKRPTEIPIILSVLIQDDLVSHVGNEIKGMKDFIKNLPNGSIIMVGYITAGSLRVTQEFTDDRVGAANSLRVPIGSPTAAPFSPYIELLDAVQRFDGQPKGKRMVLLISDGLDLSEGFRGNPTSTLYLDRAIKEAQRQGVAVYSFYAPSVGVTSRSRLASNYGQGALNRLAEETGAEAFFSGRDFVTFDPYFKELNELIANQWLITYQSSNTSKGFRQIEVKTDFDLHLHYPRGYYLK